MAARGVWGIDLGESALRAAHGMNVGERIAITAFDVIEYKQPLSLPGANKGELLGHALTTFLARNSVGKDKVVVCMPGHMALVKFVKLPPVDRDTIPDVVHYEASVQIPFPLQEVVWDYHPIDRGFVPGEQVEVGLFAMRTGLVQELLSSLTMTGLEPDVLTVAPVTIYNYIQYDWPPGSTANVIMDMGCSNTVLLVLSQDTVWTRNLPVGGNDFTKALMEAFDIPFDKAESLKKRVADSDQAKRAAEALEPVFARLVDELEKSLGYYRSLNPDVLMENIQALGAGFRLPGLAKYVSDNVNIPIRALTRLQNFDTGQAKNPELYKQHALSFARALGLVVQGLEQGPYFDINLLPPEAVTKKILARKKPYAFAALAMVLGLAGIGYLKVANTKALINKAAPDKQKVDRILAGISSRKTKFDSVKDVSEEKEKLAELLAFAKERGHWPEVLRRVTAPIKQEPDNNLLWLISIRGEPVLISKAAEELIGISRAVPFGGALAEGLAPEEFGLGSGMDRRGFEEERQEREERLIARLEITGEMNPFVLPDCRPSPSFDGTLYVATHYANILAEDPWFYGVRITSTKQQEVRFLDKDDNQIPREQALDEVGRLLPGAKEVEFTEFTIELYADWKEELPKLVEKASKGESEAE